MHGYTMNAPWKVAGSHDHIQALMCIFLLHGEFGDLSNCTKKGTGDLFCGKTQWT